MGTQKNGTETVYQNQMDIEQNRTKQLYQHQHQNGTETPVYGNQPQNGMETPLYGNQPQNGTETPVYGNQPQNGMETPHYENQLGGQGRYVNVDGGDDTYLSDDYEQVVNPGSHGSGNPSPSMDDCKLSLDNQYIPVVSPVRHVRPQDANQLREDTLGSSQPKYENIKAAEDEDTSQLKNTATSSPNAGKSPMHGDQGGRRPRSPKPRIGPGNRTSPTSNRTEVAAVLKSRTLEPGGRLLSEGTRHGDQQQPPSTSPKPRPHKEILFFSEDSSGCTVHFGNGSVASGTSGGGGSVPNTSATQGVDGRRRSATVPSEFISEEQGGEGEMDTFYANLTGDVRGLDEMYQNVAQFT